MDRLRIGVVGLGFGQHHVRTLANPDQAELVAVADRHPDVPGGSAAYAQAYGATPYHDGVEMIEYEVLDAVSICTSPRGRESLIEVAARRGVPMCITCIRRHRCRCRSASMTALGRWPWRWLSMNRHVQGRR